MHQALKHVLETKSIAKDFLERLNDRGYSAQIMELLEEIREVNRLDALHRASSKPWISLSIEIRKILQLQTSIKSVLQRYPMIPMLRVGPDGWSHSFDRPASIKEKFQQDYVVLQYIHEVCELGFLSKLERCDYAKCRKWFLRRVVGQRFHNARCREYAFKSTTEWRAYRAKKAREYYRLHKDKNVK
jgi:hypothetical protein